MAMTKRARPKDLVRHPCPACGSKGIIDFLDLVRGQAELHCRACPTIWAEQTHATMDHLAANG